MEFDAGVYHLDQSQLVEFHDKTIEPYSLRLRASIERRRST